MKTRRRPLSSATSLDETSLHPQARFFLPFDLNFKWKTRRTHVPGERSDVPNERWIPIRCCGCRRLFFWEIAASDGIHLSGSLGRSQLETWLVPLSLQRRGITSQVLKLRSRHQVPPQRLFFFPFFLFIWKEKEEGVSWGLGPWCRGREKGKERTRRGMPGGGNLESNKDSISRHQETIPLPSPPFLFLFPPPPSRAEGVRWVSCLIRRRHPSGTPSLSTSSPLYLCGNKMSGEWGGETRLWKKIR